jgi:hypothetical protein
MLALLALWALAENWRTARFIVWVFALEGTIDLIDAITLAQLYKAATFMGAAYCWIPVWEALERYWKPICQEREAQARCREHYIWRRPNRIADDGTQEGFPQCRTSGEATRRR